MSGRGSAKGSAARGRRGAAAKAGADAAEWFMRLALREAEKGVGRTAPNPAVGAVVVKDGRVVARGHHAKAGGPHAEVVALRAAGARARGADLYVTLEPCGHYGRTPPCADAVLAAGVRRVFCGSADPNPLVDGKGIARLRAHGVEVVTGVLRAECDALNADWLREIAAGAPSPATGPAKAFAPKPAAIARVKRAIAAIRAGRMVIITDDEDRENEGDLCVAAEKVTPEHVNFMATHGRGLVCLTLTPEKTRALRLPLMVDQAVNTSGFGTAFTISIEAKRGVSTGISAHDRAHTIRTAMKRDARPEDLARPGHVFPLRARPGGVLERGGQTEGSVDLARLAGLEPAGVICEVMNDDGTMARRPELEVMSERFDIPLVSVADLIAYRLRHDAFVRRAAEAPIPTGHGPFRMAVYETDLDGSRHVALLCGDLSGDAPVLCRLQRACLAGDAFGSSACGCGPRLEAALAEVARAGRGVVLYLDQEVVPAAVQDRRASPVRAGAPSWVDSLAALAAGGQAPAHPADVLDDPRACAISVQILRDLGVGAVRLLAASEVNASTLEGCGVSVAEVRPLPDAERRKHAGER